MTTTQRPRATWIWIAAAALGATTLVAQTPAPVPAAPGQVPVVAPGARGRGARGGGVATETSDFSPKSPYLPRTPSEEQKSFVMPNGYRMELVRGIPS